MTPAEVSSLKGDVRRFIDECEHLLNKLVVDDEGLTWGSSQDLSLLNGYEPNA